MTLKPTMRGMLGAALTSIAMVLAAGIFLLPSVVRYAVHAALGELGVAAEGGRVSVGLDRTEIAHVGLSGHGFADLAATYSVEGLLRARLKTLEIADASLHGKITPEGSLAIDGYRPNALQSAPAADLRLPAEQVLIRHVTLALDTPMGPVSLTGNGALAPVDDRLQFSGDVAAKAKELEVHAPLKVAFGPQGLAVDLESMQSPQAAGAVALHVKAARPESRTRADGTLQFHDFGFAAPQLVLKGANGSVAFTRLSPLTTADRQHLTIERLVFGETLTDLSIDFALRDGHVLSILDASGRVMGGEMGIHQQAIDLGSQEQNLTVQVKGIDLAQLLALADFSGLSASGRLDGTIPIRHKNDTIRIDNAVMNATEPGVLRYDPADPPSFLKDAQSQEILVLRDALKDFHYQKLTVAISGVIGADEEIKMALTGANPSLYNGKTIELNLAFSGSLDKIARWSMQSFGSPLEAVRKLKPAPGGRE